MPLLRTLGSRIRAFLCSVVILFTFLTFFYFLCLYLEDIELFHSLLAKGGVSMAVRALRFYLLKIGCSGALALAIGFAVKALLATEAAPYLVNMVLPAGAEASVNPAPGRNDAGPSNAGPYNGVDADSPLRSFPSVPSSLTPLPSDPSVPSLPSLPSLEENNLFGREESVDQPAHAPAPLPADPDIPQLPIPLVEDYVRMRELEERMALYLIGIELSADVRNSILASQVVIEKKVEAALVSDGLNPNTILAKRGQIRGFLFYPRSRLLGDKTYLDYVKSIDHEGTRACIPYRRVVRAIQDSELLL